MSSKLRLERTWLLAAALVACCAACVTPQRARLEPEAPLMPAEADAAARLEDASCAGEWSWLLPGVGQLCRGERGEGAALLGLTALEGGSAALETPGLSRSAWLIALQNTWLYGIADIYREDQLARQALFAPQDDLATLAAAPFQPQLLLEPEIGLGIVGMLGGALLWTAATLPLRPDTTTNTSTARLGAAESLRFGGSSAFLLTHVAVGEEVIFRGLLQSSLSRELGEGWGWGLSAAIFGATHLVNLVALPQERRLSYATLDVPFIALLGGYLGWVYQDAGYSLASPVAVHFWYDALISLGYFIGSGGEQPFQISWGGAL